MPSRVGKQPKRSRPRRRSTDLLQFLLGAVQPGQDAPIACLVRASPASVSSIGRVPRRTTGSPTSRSRAAMCWLTADCVMPSALAAADENPPSARRGGRGLEAVVHLSMSYYL